MTRLDDVALNPQPLPPKVRILLTRERERVHAGLERRRIPERIRVASDVSSGNACCSERLRRRQQETAEEKIDAD